MLARPALPRLALPRLALPGLALTRVALPAAGAVAGGGCAAALYLVNPHGHQVFFPCPLHATTGLYCPFCGGLRMVHDLLHGDLVAALHDDAFAVPLVIIGFAAWLNWTFCRWRGRPAPARPAWLSPALIALMIIWTVLRNLPYPPFTALRPTALPIRPAPRPATRRPHADTRHARSAGRRSKAPRQTAKRADQSAGRRRAAAEGRTPSSKVPHRERGAQAARRGRKQGRADQSALAAVPGQPIVAGLSPPPQPP